MSRAVSRDSYRVTERWEVLNADPKTRGLEYWVLRVFVATLNVCDRSVAP
jgi:hypothetical protein